MIRSIPINQIKDFRIDVQSLQDDGTFPCPKCGKQIDPKDCSEENYVVFEPRIVNDQLVRLTLHCLRCNAIITLENFLVADKQSGGNKE